MPKARNKAGFAFPIVRPASAPINHPTSIGVMVAPIELIDPPNCINWFPLFPPPPNVFSIGFTTVFSMHMLKPEIKAPAK